MSETYKPLNFLEQIIEQDLSDLKSRVSTIEAKRTQRLEDENKSLIEKVNIFKKR